MTTATQRNYKTMMILDTRGREEDIEKLLEEVKQAISGLGVEVQSAEHLGRRDFARQPDAKVPAGNYIQFQLAGPPGTGQRLREHFRLNPLVYRILFQGE